MVPHVKFDHTEKQEREIISDHTEKERDNTSDHTEKGERNKSN